MLPEDVAAACRALARTKFFDGDINRSFANGCVSVNMGLGKKNLLLKLRWFPQLQKKALSLPTNPCALLKKYFKDIKYFEIF